MSDIQSRLRELSLIPDGVGILASHAIELRGRVLMLETQVRSLEKENSSLLDKMHVWDRVRELLGGEW
jgi:hypothetical protein